MAVNADNQPTVTYSAFVSHATKDREAAATIAQCLEEKGLRCWIAPRDVRPGVEYGEEIIRGINQSRCFILVLSEAANLAAAVRREVERAASKGKPIYPVRIEEVMPSPKLEFFISMHHWLDAWDGLLTDHASRLAEAIESNEEWVGNRVAARLRRFRIGMGLTATLAVTTLILGFIFATDVRDLLRNQRERAVNALESKGISVDVDGLTKAVAAVSVPDLALLLDAGITGSQLNKAFSQAAPGFFERSVGDAAAIDWLRKALERGLDPNLPVPDGHYVREGILAAAARAANADAMIALLDGGASPHPYQDLWLSPFSLPRFLFPYHYVLTHEGWNRDQKASVADALSKAGAVLVPLQADPGSAQWIDQNHTRSVEQVLQGAEEFLGIAHAEMPSACAGRRPTPICEMATERTGQDWCEIVARLPVRLLWNPDSYDSTLLRIDIQYLLNVVDGRGYLLTTDTIGPEGGYGLLELSADLRQWNLYRYSDPGAGLGHCKPGVSGQVNDECWRRWTMTYTPGSDIVRVEDYYEYDALFDCSKSRP